MLDLIVNLHKGAKGNRRFDRLMINSNMYREKIIFQLNKQKEKDKENIEFLGIDTIMTERLVALHTRVDMRKLTDDEIRTLSLLRKVWLYTYTFFNSGNIVDTKEFLGLNLEIKRIAENDNDDVTRLLLISYNYLLKVIKYSKDDSKQKRKLNFFMKISKT